VFESAVEDQSTDVKYVIEEIPGKAVETDPDGYSPWSWAEIHLTGIVIGAKRRGRCESFTR